MNIQLIKDIPERGKRWTTGAIVYNVDRSIFQKYIDSGHAREIFVNEPRWQQKQEEIDDEIQEQPEREKRKKRFKKSNIF